MVSSKKTAKPTFDIVALTQHAGATGRRYFAAEVLHAGVRYGMDSAWGSWTCYERVDDGGALTRTHGGRSEARRDVTYELASALQTLAVRQLTDAGETAAGPGPRRRP